MNIQMHHWDRGMNTPAVLHAMHLCSSALARESRLSFKYFRVTITNIQNTNIKEVKPKLFEVIFRLSCAPVNTIFFTFLHKYFVYLKSTPVHLHNPVQTTQLAKQCVSLYQTLWLLNQNHLFSIWWSHAHPWGAYGGGVVWGVISLSIPSTVRLNWVSLFHVSPSDLMRTKAVNIRSECSLCLYAFRLWLILVDPWA